MKLITLAARLGTVILAMSLALSLVWLIPSQPPPISTGRGSRMFIRQEMYMLASVGAITPQSEFDISVQANGTVLVYLLDVHSSAFMSWIRSWIDSQYPGLGSTQISQVSYVSALNAFLESNPDTVLWKSDPTNDMSKQFFSDKVGNLTLIIANPSSSDIRLNYDYKLVNLIAPKSRLLLLIQLLAPVGLVLTIPSIIVEFRKGRSQ